MRTARVFTHFRCNQRCGYCTYRRSDDAPRFIVGAAVEARLAAALEAGAEELALSGGEPTMRTDLEALVAFAKARGAKRVVLETNATLIDEARAAALREAGLDGARVNLVGADARVDAVTSDEGGFDATLRGLRALASAGIELTVEAALVRSTLATLPALPALLAREGAVSKLTLVVPSESPEPAQLLGYAEAAAAITEVAEAARGVGLAAKLAPDTAPPPCVFPELGRVAHLFSLTRGGGSRPDHRRIAACASCALVDRCEGVAAAHLDRFGEPEARPVSEDRMRRRLSLISTVEEQIAREFVTPNRYANADQGQVDEDLVRINFHCNQSCRFCFVSTHLPQAGDAAVRAAIAAAAAGGRRIAITGGEPTLNPSLVDYVRLAKQSSHLPVLLQTNAIRLASPELADAVVGAGVDEAFVSLHGSRAEIGDVVTRAPGTFDKTVLGVDNLVARGVQVTLNFVICETNRTDLVAFVRMAGSRWPRARLNVSFVAPSTDVVPREREFIPRYSEVMPELAEAIGLAGEMGVVVEGFESMCGIPLCLVPSSLDRYLDLALIPPGYDKGEFFEAEACTRCDLRGRCYGLRRGYAELHGTDELRPVRSARTPALVSDRTP